MSPESPDDGQERPVQRIHYAEGEIGRSEGPVLERESDIRLGFERAGIEHRDARKFL